MVGDSSCCDAADRFEFKAQDRNEHRAVVTGTRPDTWMCRQHNTALPAANKSQQHYAALPAVEEASPAAALSEQQVSHPRPVYHNNTAYFFGHAIYKHVLASVRQAPAMLRWRRRAGVMEHACARSVLA